MTEQKQLTVRQVAERVAGVDEHWLRGKIRNGEIVVVRTGYNYTVPNSELAKIARLAANRPRK